MNLVGPALTLPHDPSQSQSSVLLVSLSFLGFQAPEEILCRRGAFGPAQVNKRESIILPRSGLLSFLYYILSFEVVKVPMLYHKVGKSERAPRILLSLIGDTSV